MNNAIPQALPSPIRTPTATATTVSPDPLPYPTSAAPELSIPSTPKHHLDRLIDELSTLILILICATYYLDTFSLLLAFRFITHTSATTAGIRSIVSTTVVTVATHIFHDLTVPEGTEQWNHGGLLVDFVGEKPTSRLRLLSLDVLVLILQLMYLTLHYKKLSLGGEIVTEQAQSEQTRVQDLEAEEAGVLRAGLESASPGDQAEIVEMDRLLPDGSRRESVRQSETDDTVVLDRRDLKMVFFAPPAAGPTEQQRTAARYAVEQLIANIRRT